MAEAGGGLRRFLESRPGLHAWFLTWAEALLLFGAAGFVYVYLTVYVFHAAAVDWYVHHWTPWLRLDNFGGYSVISAFVGYISWGFLKHYWALARPGSTEIRGGPMSPRGGVLEPTNEDYHGDPDGPPAPPAGGLPPLPFRGQGRGP